MSTLAYHMRITGLHVTNDDVDSRQAAITAIKTAWGKITKIDEIFVKAANVAVVLGGGGTPEVLGKEVEVAVQKKASAFLYAERPLEIGIVAGMVAIEIMATPPGGSGWQLADVLAAALWSALGFQPPIADPKREELRMSVLQVARKRSIEGAEKARQRINVPDVGKISLIPGAEDKLGKAIQEATGPTIDALRRNSALDREELDFLWWAQLRRSRLLKRPFNAIGEVQRVIAAGIEGANFLRRMPSEVQREIVLRIDANPTMTLAAVLDALDTDRETLATPFAGKLPVGGETLFPLLTAMTIGRADDLPASKIVRDAEEWGARALLEAALLKMKAAGPGTL